MALALLALAGCGGPTGGAALFANELAEQDVVPSEQLSTGVQEACVRIEEGSDVQAVAVVLAMRNGLQLDQAGEILAAGVRAFCPEQQAALDGGS